MGCDIRFYFERKEGGLWKQIEVDPRLVPNDRNYDLFYFLAGIRYPVECDLDSVFEGRGFPRESSFALDSDEMKEQVYTYAYLDEILSVPWKEAGLADNYFPVFFREVLPRILDEWGCLNFEQKRSIRVIMGFSN